MKFWENVFSEMPLNRQHGLHCVGFTSSLA